MMVGLVGLFIIAALIVTARGAVGRTPRQGLGTAVRRFFQLGMLFGLVCVVAIGLSALIARPMHRDVLAVSGDADLAQGLSFTIVGIPLLWLVARWTTRRMAEDSRETASLGWSCYLAIAELTALAVAALAVQDLLAWIVRAREFDAGALARSVVWGSVWFVHRRITAKTTASGVVRDHEYAAAAFGLWSAGLALADLVSSSLRSWPGLSSATLVAGPDHPVAKAAVGAFVGAGVWFIYWVRKAQRGERTLHWHAYVLLAGVAAGMVVAIVSAAIVLYEILVWFLGTPDSPDAASHFSGSIDATGVFVAGAVIWWYHRTLLAQVRQAQRDEARRVYEYLVAFIALAATTTGCLILLVAMFEALTASTQLAGPSAGNTLLLAATLLLVGAPLWWWFWRAIQRAVHADEATETASAARRVYLFLLFGAAGVAAVVAMLVAVYVLIDDLVSARFGLVTLRSMRWALAVLLAMAVVAQYHWRIYRADRTVAAPAVGGPHFVLLAGAPDHALAALVAARTGAQVQAWTGAGDPELWSVDAVMAALSGAAGEDLVVVADEQALRAIAVHR